jgi:hypothetical protein
LITLVWHRHVSQSIVPLLPLVVGWILIVLLLQRRVPPQRTWTFLLPLFYMMVAAGFLYLLEHRAKWQRGVSMVLIVIYAGVIVDNEVIIQSAQTGGVTSTDQAALLLRDEYLQPGDRILTHLREGAPLHYYLEYYETPPIYELRTHHDDDPGFLMDLATYDGTVYVFWQPLNSTDELFETFIWMERPTDVNLSLRLVEDFGDNHLYVLEHAPIRR